MFKKLGSIRETFRIAGPVMVESLMASTVMMINTAMVGALGRDASATVGVNSAPSWLLNSIPMGLCVGSTVMVARSIGAGNREKANDVANQTVGGIFILAVVVSIAMFFISQYIPALVNADPVIRGDAALYLRTVSLTIVPNFIGFACSGMLRGAGNTKTPMFAGLMTNVITMSLNFMLIYESLGFTVFGREFTLPRAGLGVQGAAVSTAIAQVIFGIFMLTRVLGKNKSLTVTFNKVFKFSREILRPIFKVGIPAMGERLTITFGQVMYASTVNSISATATSAHHIAVQIESLAFMPANALSVSATTLVGQSLGAKDKDKALGYANTTLLFSIIIGVVCFFAFFFFPAPLINLFIDDMRVVEMGAGAMRIMAPVEPMFCMLMVITGILRGAGDTKFALYAGIAGMWGIRLGAAYAAVNWFGMDLRGAWIGMALDIIVRFTIMFVRYKRMKWLTTEEI